MNGLIAAHSEPDQRVSGNVSEQYLIAGITGRFHRRY